MKAKLFQNKLTIKKSSIHGYGVFAEEDINPEEIVEECYAIVGEDHQKSSLLRDFYFAAESKSAVATGYGSIYNHSDIPNTGYEYDAENQIIVFKARRFIKKGEEILIYYGSDWFSDRALKKIELSWYRKLLCPSILLLFRGFVACCGCLIIIRLLKDLLT